MSAPEVESEKPASLGWMAYQAIHVRLRFLLALGMLAALALFWPWLTNGWERARAWLNPYSHESAVSSNSEYFCPMDPGVVSVWPAICPICNMDLIVRKKSEAVMLPSGVVARMQISPYRLMLAGVRTVPIQDQIAEIGFGEGRLMVPITSIVHRDEETLIYIERAPGMLDGVQVKIGNRIDDYYEIVEGEIQVGQHVVVMGTLLVDAESRLNPNLSTQYFGASDKRVSDTAPTAKRKSVHVEGERVLNPKDRAIVEEQRYCPVTRATLGSMGAPVFVTVDQRRVAICCEGCQSQLEKEPSKYLGWLDEKLAGERKPK